MILREYEEDGYKVTEYTSDGKNVSATVREQIIDVSEIVNPEPNPEPTLEQIQLQTLLNTEFLVIMSEIG